MVDIVQKKPDITTISFTTQVSTKEGQKFDPAKVVAVWKNNNSSKGLSLTELDRLSNNVTVYSETQANLALSLYCEIKGKLIENGMTAAEAEKFLSNITITVQDADSSLSPQRYDVTINFNKTGVPAIVLKDVKEPNSEGKVDDKTLQALANGMKTIASDEQGNEQTVAPPPTDPPSFDPPSPDNTWKLLDLISKAKMEIFNSVSNEKTPEEKAEDKKQEKKAAEKKQEQKTVDNKIAAKKLENKIGDIKIENKQGIARAEDAMSTAQSAVNRATSPASTGEDIEKAEKTIIDAESDKAKNTPALVGGR